MVLKEIMQHFIDRFQCMVMNPYDPMCEIFRIEIINSTTIYNTQTLYLLPMAENAPVTKAQEPEESSQRSNFSIPADCIFLTDASRALPAHPGSILIQPYPDQIEAFHFINHLFQDQSEFVSKVSTIYQMMNEHASLPDILSTASNYFNGPVSVCDPSYQFLATTLGYQEADRFLAESEILSLKRYHIIDRIYRSLGAFESITPDHPDHKWIFCAVRIRGVTVGFIAISHGIKETDSFLLQLASVTAEVVSIILAEDEHRFLRTEYNYEDFFIGMLEGRYHDEALLRSRILLFDRRFYKYFCVLYLTATKKSDLRTLRQRQLSSLRQYYTNSISVIYKDGIVLLLTQDAPSILNEALFFKLNEFAKLNHLTIGMSQPFSNILETGLYFQQAYTAQQIGSTQLPDDLIYSASDLLPYFLLSSLSQAELSSGVHYHLRLLKDFDAANHTSLLLTLRMFLQNGRNAAKTAETMELHRSTLFYRIKKIEDVLSISLTDSHLLFLYELSFMTLDHLA
ncbi:MAG: PucR family transcriptional regulator [Lachnospiraceae bacterium]